MARRLQPSRRGPPPAAGTNAAGASPSLSPPSDQLDMIGLEAQPRRQQRAERIVAAVARVERMKEQLRLIVEPRRDRGMAGRGPAAGGFEQRPRLLAVGAEHMIGDGDTDSVGGRAEIIAGIE